ncbi:hypothetical protein KGY79_06565 [Candidatus Bipolaricaulota bacterium]|nr:hypothetical protein [Candidatus Bipolaricaulota bacterium]
MTPSKYVVVNYNSCKVEQCLSSEDLDGCPAESACSPGVLTQEEPDEPPILPSPRMCVGCGDCIRNCTYDAISSSRG